MLGPLSSEDLVALAGDALHCRAREAAPLADLVYEKTAGNPFFAIQFLGALHEEGLIAFDGRAGAFRWDIAKIRAKCFTDNVVDLMVGKLARLPERSQGGAGDALVPREAPRTPPSWRWSAAARWRRRTRISGRCASARGSSSRAWTARTTSSTTVSRRRRTRGSPRAIGPVCTSRSAGCWRRARRSPEEGEERSFEVVSQLDRGAALITSWEERARVAAWNLGAGKRRQALAWPMPRRSRTSARARRCSRRTAGPSGTILAFALELHLGPSAST